MGVGSMTRVTSVGADRRPGRRQAPFGESETFGEHQISGNESDGQPLSLCGSFIFSVSRKSLACLVDHDAKLTQEPHIRHRIPSQLLEIIDLKSSSSGHGI